MLCMNNAQFAVIEDPQGEFLNQRVALFPSLFDAWKFVVQSSNPDELEVIDLQDESTQEFLLNTPHSIIG